MTKMRKKSEVNQRPLDANFCYWFGFYYSWN